MNRMRYFRKGIVFVMAVHSLSVLAEASVNKGYDVGSHDSNARTVTLEHLYHRALEIHKYFVEDAEKRNVPEYFRDLESKKIAFREMLKMTIEDAYDRRDVRGLRMINRDFDEIVKDYPESKRTELEGILIGKGLLKY